MLSLQEMQEAAKMLEVEGDMGVRSCAAKYGWFAARLLLVARLRRRCTSEEIAGYLQAIGLIWFTIEEAKLWSDEELEAHMEKAGLTELSKNAVRRMLERPTTPGWKPEHVGHWETVILEATKKLGIDFIVE